MLDAGILKDSCEGSRVDVTHGNVAIIKKKKQDEGIKHGK